MDWNLRQIARELNTENSRPLQLMVFDGWWPSVQRCIAKAWAVCSSKPSHKQDWRNWAVNVDRDTEIIDQKNSWFWKHCKNAKLPWLHNIKLSVWSCLFVFLSFCLFVFLSFCFLSFCRKYTDKYLQIFVRNSYPDKIAGAWWGYVCFFRCISPRYFQIHPSPQKLN